MLISSPMYSYSPKVILNQASDSSMKPIRGQIIQTTPTSRPIHFGMDPTMPIILSGLGTFVIARIGKLGWDTTLIDHFPENISAKKAEKLLRSKTLRPDLKITLINNLQPIEDKRDWKFSPPIVVRLLLIAMRQDQPKELQTEGIRELQLFTEQFPKDDKLPKLVADLIKAHPSENGFAPYREAMEALVQYAPELSYPAKDAEVASKPEPSSIQETFVAPRRESPAARRPNVETRRV